MMYGNVDMTAEQLEEEMVKIYTDDQKSTDFSLVIAILYEARGAPKAPSKYVGKYGCWDNKGRKTEVNRLLAILAKVGYIVRSTQGKTPCYQCTPQIVDAISELYAKYETPTPKKAPTKISLKVFF